MLFKFPKYSVKWTTFGHCRPADAEKMQEKNLGPECVCGFRIRITDVHGAQLSVLCV